MNTKPSILDFETKLHQIYAFSLLSTSESFLELDDENQLSYLYGLNCLIAELKSNFYDLHKNNILASSQH